MASSSVWQDTNLRGSRSDHALLMRFLMSVSRPVPKASTIRLLDLETTRQGVFAQKCMIDIYRYLSIMNLLYLSCCLCRYDKSSPTTSKMQYFKTNATGYVRGLILLASIVKYTFVFHMNSRLSITSNRPLWKLPSSKPYKPQMIFHRRDKMPRTIQGQIWASMDMCCGIVQWSRPDTPVVDHVMMQSS